MDNDWILAGSSGSLEGIKNIIAKFYFSEKKHIQLIKEGSGLWRVRKTNIKTPDLKGVRVIKKGRRYRFEFK